MTRTKKDLCVLKLSPKLFDLHKNFDNPQTNFFDPQNFYSIFLQGEIAEKLGSN